MGGYCMGGCNSTGYSLHHWVILKRVKCSVCMKAFDDTGQKACDCCGYFVARKPHVNAATAVARAIRYRA